jgi:hypothetical protein
MTKHAVRILFLCCLIAVAWLPDAAAQNELCKPDCQESNWGIGGSQAVILPNGCKVMVDFATRCACGANNDIGIVSMTPDPNDPRCASVKNMPLKDAVDLITLEMLKGSGFDFPPPCGELAVGECSTNWRVIKGSCWAKVYYPSPSSEYYTSCSQTACCLKPYKVCRNACGRTAEAQPWYPYGSCPGAVKPYPANPNISGECTPVCG